MNFFNVAFSLYNFLSDQSFFFFHSPLPHYRSFSCKTRTRIALLDLVTESVIHFFVLLQMISFICSTTFLFFVVNDVANGIWHQVISNLCIYQLYTVVDFILIVLLLHYILCKVYLIYKTVFLATYSWSLHMKEVSKEATWKMKLAKLNRKNIFRSSQITFIWSFFMREHSLLLVDLIHFNKHFASTLIFWHYTPIIISTIYCLCLLYFMPLFWTARLLIFVLFLTLFSTFALLYCLPMAVQTLYSSDSEIYEAQMSCRSHCSSTYILFKLKLMAYYEVLRTDIKFTFTFGNHSKVDSLWLMQVCFE